MQDTNTESIIKLIAKYCSPKDILNQDTRIYHDLNIYGDDADELLEEYSKLFNIRISSFKFTDYFPEEGDIITSTIIRILSLKPPKKYKELKIGDLTLGIQTGSLDLS